MTTDEQSRALHVLLVDDSETDIELAKRTFAKSGVAHRLDIAKDGAEALETLHRCKIGDPERDYSFPDLVLLDLGLPALDGVDVLESIKADPRLASVPVVVVTGSTNQLDHQRCVDLGANLFLKKPIKIVDVVYVVLSVQKYWVAIDRAAGRRAA